MPKVGISELTLCPLCVRDMREYETASINYPEKTQINIAANCAKCDLLFTRKIKVNKRDIDISGVVGGLEWK